MFAIEEIPRLMKDKGWWRGARLMETWFSRIAAVAPSYSKPVTDVITVDWTLRYDRAKKVYDKAIADQIWVNAAAKKEITKMLDRKGLLRGLPACRPFGDLTQPVADLDADYINFRAVSGYHLDDLTAALGAFTFRVVVSGTVTKASDLSGGDLPGHEVMINQFGIYIRDSYDFNGDQSLGCWDYHGNVSAFPFAGSDCVMNSDYRKWRQRTGKGGDFLVFSDLKRYQLNALTTFNTSDVGK